MMAFKPSSPPWCVASPVGAVYTLSTKAEVSKLATGDVVGLPRASNFNVMLGIVKSEDGKPGGDTDKVNARHKDGLTPEECEAACDAIPVDSSDGICAGYATKDSGTLRARSNESSTAPAWRARARRSTRMSSRPTTAWRWARVPTHRHVA